MALYLCLLAEGVCLLTHPEAELLDSPLQARHHLEPSLRRCMLIR